jgi:hypothetical protein
MSTQTALANEIRALAHGMASRAADLEAQANALDSSESCDAELSDEFAGPARAVQILQMVEDLLNPRPNSTDHFRRVLLSGLGYKQRTAHQQH